MRVYEGEEKLMSVSPHGSTWRFLKHSLRAGRAWDINIKRASSANRILERKCQDWGRTAMVSGYILPSLLKPESKGGSEGRREKESKGQTERGRTRTIWDSLILGLWDHGIGRCATVCSDFFFFFFNLTDNEREVWTGPGLSKGVFFFVGLNSGLLDGAWGPSDSHSGTKNELSGEWMSVCYICV